MIYYFWSLQIIEASILHYFQTKWILYGTFNNFGELIIALTKLMYIFLDISQARYHDISTMTWDKYENKPIKNTSRILWVFETQFPVWINVNSIMTIWPLTHQPVLRFIFHLQTGFYFCDRHLIMKTRFNSLRIWIDIKLKHHTF